MIAYTLGTILLAYLFTVSLLFVLVYGLLVTDRSPSGNHLLAFAAVVGAFAGEELFVRAAGRWEGHDETIAVLVLAAAVLMTWRCVRLWQTTFSPNRSKTPRARRCVPEQDVPRI